MDAITLIIQDHRNVDEMFTRFEQSSDPGEKRQIIDTIIEELSIHAAIEERELYPVMQRVFGEEGQEDVEHAEHEHAEVKATLAVLAKLSPEDERFDEMAAELIADVRHHVEEEEEDLLPKFRETVSDEELEELGRRLEAAKSQAPTKPSADELSVLTRDELYEFAQVLDIDQRSDMDKAQLASALTS